MSRKSWTGSAGDGARTFAKRVLPFTLLVTALAVWVNAAGVSVRAQATGDEPRIHMAPIMLETGAGRPVAAEWVQLVTPEQLPGITSTTPITPTDTPTTLVSTALLRFPTDAEDPGPPVFILSANLFAPNRPLPEVDRLLDFVALFNEDADVLVVGLRGLLGAQPTLRCASTYDATLDQVADKALLAADLGAYFSTCDEFWGNAGVDTGAFNAATMAADLDAARDALGYSSYRLLGVDFGSQVALEATRRYPDTVDRLMLILPVGSDQLMKLPANVQAQLETLAQQAQNDPSLTPRIPDFLALVDSVLTRLETQPVTVTVRDPATRQRVDVTVGKYDLQYATARALTDATQWSLPARYFEMNQGDFTWLAQQAHAWRTGITANLANLTALCASGASADRRTQVETEAPQTLLGDAINGVYFDLCTAVSDPDLGDDFRDEIVTEVPTLFVVGSLDAYAPPANVDEIVAGFENAQTLTVNGGTHNLLAEALPQIAPVLTDFMLEDPLELIATTSVFLTPRFEPIQIEPVTTLVWAGQYFNNRNLQSDPTIVRDDTTVDFDWGEGSPSADINPDNFSVRWTTTTDLPAGTYRVSLWVDDGVRMWVDDVLVVDQWVEGTARNFITDINLVRGPHNVRVEYFEAEGLALARMNVVRVENYPEWRTEYFDNIDLAGAPAVVRNEQSIDYDWGALSPVVGVPADNFSARWTRRVSLPAGTYDFALTVTGGARMWLNGQLLIDDWQAGPSRVLTARSPILAQGEHDLRVEYFKTVGNGGIRLRWVPVVEVITPPSAVIVAPRFAQVGQSITLDGTSSTPGTGGEITAFAWDLGDGNVTAGQVVEYGYTAPGIYNVTLTVTDATGLSDDATVQIRVDPAVATPVPDQPPVAVIAAPLQGVVGEPVLFDASQSRSVNPIVSYAWQFGDGSTANAVQVSKQYAVPGVFNVILTLEDSEGLTGSTNRLISIYGPTPTATPDLPPTPTPIPPTPTLAPTPTVEVPPTLPPTGEPLPTTVPPEIATLTPQPTVDPNATPTPTLDPNVTATPDPNATPTVVLVPPTARIFAIANGARLPEFPENGIPVVTVAPGQPVTFDGSDSTQGTSPIVSYFWNMGDGNSQGGDNNVPSYMYNTPGRYTVTLTVLDSANLSSTAALIVDVRLPE